MDSFYCFFLGFLVLTHVEGQESISMDLPLEQSNQGLITSGFSYPSFLIGEQHSEFGIRYPLNQDFEAELQGFYDTYMLANVTRFALRTKYYVSKKLYFFSGMAGEIEQNKTGGKPLPPRFYLQNGTGYDFNERMNLELKQELLINKNATGTYGLPSLLSVKGKYKF